MTTTKRKRNTTQDARSTPNQVPSFNDLVGDVAALVVGSDKRRVLVHEAVICHSSPFFRAALSKHWKEMSDKSVHLPEETIEHVVTYVQWLYTDKIVIPYRNLPEDTTRTQDRYFTLVELYLMGDRFVDTTFQNTVMTSLMAETISAVLKSKSVIPVPNGRTIAHAYTSTTKDDPLRTLFRDIVLHYGVSTFNDEGHDLSDFFEDIARSTMFSAFKRSDYEHVRSLDNVSRYHIKDFEEEQTNVKEIVEEVGGHPI